jgi:hypothetical protein
MSWIKRWKGKYVVINPDNPEALGECDDSGLTFNRKDLVKQMEWRGDNLVWTGFMVGKPYLDKPQEQNRPPLVKADPRPVADPRLPTPYNDPDSPVVPPYKQLLAQLNNFYWGS